MSTKLTSFAKGKGLVPHSLVKSPLLSLSNLENEATNKIYLTGVKEIVFEGRDLLYPLA